jgi:altronate dehydratase small subunit
MSQPGRQWVIMHPNDDVAVALTPLPVGAEIPAPDGVFHIVLKQPIPFGHKFAIRAIPKGGLVHKYGQVIGIATCEISPGEHVHVHNVESRRGRGDLAQGAAGDTQATAKEAAQ